VPTSALAHEPPTSLSTHACMPQETMDAMPGSAMHLPMSTSPFCQAPGYAPAYATQVRA